MKTGEEQQERARAAAREMWERSHKEGSMRLSPGVLWASLLGSVGARGLPADQHIAGTVL